GAAASRARRHLRREVTEPERLEDLLADPHLLGAVAAGSGSEAGADGVADALEQQHRERGGGGDDALGAEPGLGEAQVQRVVATRSDRAVDRDQVAYVADLG